MASERRLISVEDCPCDGCQAKPCGHPARCVKFALWLNKTVNPLPCKIGDTVWGIRYHTGVPYIKQGTVSEMAYLEDMRLAIAVKFAPKYNTRGFWGVNIFATREECEAALGGKDNG